MLLGFREGSTEGTKKPDCECGKDTPASVREEVVLELLDEDYEAHHHPWRYWHTTKDSGIPF